MNRRKFVRNGLLSGAALATVVNRATALSPLPAPAPVADFELEELTAGELQQAMTSGKYSARTITQKYLDRISEIDKQGPAINAVIELNPEALEIAVALDSERRAGRVRGPLHGIPVL